MILFTYLFYVTIYTKKSHFSDNNYDEFKLGHPHEIKTKILIFHGI